MSEVRADHPICSEDENRSSLAKMILSFPFHFVPLTLLGLGGGMAILPLPPEFWQALQQKLQQPVILYFSIVFSQFLYAKIGQKTLLIYKIHLFP